ncbi:alpha/beta hydrolase fold domain-containing protein [Streptomyces sp. NPDC050625]|uniref:alpha/beta hydrolase n=1 Tax=Streptomyces sp. NPDC050625 TaxID=3154629 RepID=UPI0034463310
MKDLSGLPPACIVAVEFDPCPDEAVAYAQNLLAAEVPVELHVFPGAYDLAF